MRDKNRYEVLMAVHMGMSTARGIVDDLGLHINTVNAALRFTEEMNITGSATWDGTREHWVTGWGVEVIDMFRAGGAS